MSKMTRCHGCIGLGTTIAQLERALDELKYSSGDDKTDIYKTLKRILEVFEGYEATYSDQIIVSLSEKLLAELR